MITAEILSVISVVLFCLTCRQFIRAVMMPVPASRLHRSYSQGAMWVDKTYKVVSWGVLMSSFLLGLVISFSQVYTQL